MVFFGILNDAEMAACEGGEPLHVTKQCKLILCCEEIYLSCRCRSAETEHGTGRDGPTGISRVVVVIHL